MEGSNRTETAGLKTHLLRGHGLLARFAELLDGLVVIAQILLAAHENDGKALAEVKDLGNPLQRSMFVSNRLFTSRVAHDQMVCDRINWGGAHLLLHVVQGIRRVNSKADQNDVGVRV